jgi:hypothetical protein
MIARMSNPGNQTDPAAAGWAHLHTLPRHACGIIRGFVEKEPGELDRLKTMGLCLYRRVEILQTGDPLIVRVFSSRLGVSARLAERVLVERCGGHSCALE